jgi:hypothetical protein
MPWLAAADSAAQRIGEAQCDTLMGQVAAVVLEEAGE